MKLNQNIISLVILLIFSLGLIVGGIIWNKPSGNIVFILGLCSLYLCLCLTISSVEKYIESVKSK